MNDLTTALTIPAGVDLAKMFRVENGIDPLIAMIEAEVRSHVPDVTTKRGRDAIASLAYKVSRSKTALDEAGKALNEDARRQIDVVDASRRRVRQSLDALRDEARKPLDDWEAAEELRLNDLKSRLRALDAGRADATSTAAHIAEVLAEIEAIGLGEDWQEYQSDAALAKDKALTELRRNLEIATRREEEQAELARLQAEAAAREEEDRRRREAEEVAARLRDRAARARTYIEQIGHGLIGGQLQGFGVLIYELETKLPPLVDDLGEHAADLHRLRLETLSNVRGAMERQRVADEARAEEERKAASERAALEAAEVAARKQAEDEERHRRELAEAKRREEEAAQRERDRIAAERKAEADARAKREADAAHRARIAADIADALRTMAGRATPEAIAEALIAGKIPHCIVRM